MICLRGIELMLYLLILVVIGIAFFSSSYFFSSLLLYANRQPIVKLPNDYGMKYEDIEFKSSDGLNLKGWLIEGTTDKIVNMTHPWLFNRHGFLAKYQGPIKYLTFGKGTLKPDVDFLKTAKALNETGFSILMFDCRNHGQSDKGITGVGISEYQDVLGVLNFINNHPTHASKKIGFVVFCMGANSTIMAMSKKKEQFYNAQCLVAIQPVSMNVFARAYMKSAYTSLGLLFIPLVNKLCQWRGGYTFEEMSPLEYAKDITVPTLIIQGQNDPWTELSDIKQIYNETPEPKELWMIPNINRRFDAYDYVGDNPEKILEFLMRFM